MHSLTVKRLTIYPLALTMKRKVSHAASERAVSEPVVVAVELMNGVTGYGETLPRAYVTGETNESVLALLQGEFTSQLLAMRPRTFVESLEAIDSLPMLTEDGHACPAARACVELALLDAYLQSWHREVADMVGWLGLPGFGPPGSARRARYSIVLASDSIALLQKTLRLTHWLGMCHFKLKVGFEDDDQRLEAVLAIIGKAIKRGRVSLRIDANGAWSLDQAVESLTRWQGMPIVAVEQPLLPSESEDENLIRLWERTAVRIFHDESLVTMEDAKRLYSMGVADGFNIRISKCGGLMPALRLAGFARAHGIDIQLGCMVGETSILSAAGVHFLQNVPRIRFCEGSFGNLLMAEDVVCHSVRFRLRGRLPRINANGLGVKVQPKLLEQHCLDEPIVVEL